MADAQPVSPGSAARMGTELVGHALPDEDLRAVAALLSGLVSEMAPMRAMEIHDTEPATTYDPSQR